MRTWTIVSFQRNNKADHTGILPTPESDEKAPPGEEEYPAILVDRIEHRNRSRLPVDGVDDGRCPEH